MKMAELLGRDLHDIPCWTCGEPSTEATARADLNGHFMEVMGRCAKHAREWMRENKDQMMVDYHDLLNISYLGESKIITDRITAGMRRLEALA